MINRDTIVAIATPPGRGGVGIIRLSGSLALAIASSITQTANPTARHAYYLPFFVDEECIDKGLLLYFKAPNSFTGEDVVEFHSHGSPVVLDYLVEHCVALGARIALPGEFSERAFLNDKIDLIQAEAVADIIHASSLTAAKLAVKSLQGDFSKKINDLTDKIIYLRLFVEAAIDFPEEEIDFLNDGKVATQLQQLIEIITAIQGQAKNGAILREGLSVVIVGKPNAGKSTLLNQLAGRDVAIVTDIAGTTRDVLRQSILIDDLPIHIIDTAGLRDSTDIIEQEGIKRAWNEVENADALVLVRDIHDPEAPDSFMKAILEKTAVSTPIIQLINKIDAFNEPPKSTQNEIYLSAKTGQGIQLLKNKIKEIAGYQPSEGCFIARRRHLVALQQAREFLVKGQNQLENHRAGELLAEDLRLSQDALSTITGQFTADDLLGEIFSSFCIGK